MAASRVGKRCREFAGSLSLRMLRRGNAGEGKGREGKVSFQSGNDETGRPRATRRTMSRDFRGNRTINC